MTEPAPDAAVTAWLARERDQDDLVALGHVRDPELVPKLLDGYEALLTQAARWEDEAVALGARSPKAGRIEAIEMHARALALRDCAAELRLVIRAELLGGA